MITNIIKNGTNYLKVQLQEDSIIGSKNNILYSQGYIIKDELSSPVFTQYNGKGTIAIGANIPNEILHLKLKPSSSYIFSSDNFAACSVNVRLTYIPNENRVIVENISDEVQYLWIFAYGNFEKIILDQEEIEIKKGLLLIYHSFMEIIEKNNFIIVKGPAKFYIQTFEKNENDKGDNIISKFLENVKNKGKIRNTLRNI